MKNLVSFVAILFFFLSVDAQSCLPNGITFSSQDDIDNFSTNYPSCTEIEGDVLIGSVSQPIPDITNLAGLSQVTKMGKLSVVNTGLTNLEGLGTLTEISGVLHVRANPDLQSFSGLSALQSLGGTLSIVDNPKILDFLGLLGLQKCAGIFIEGNDALQSFNGLENLTNIGNNPIEGIGAIVIKGNNSLTNLTGLKNIDPTTIGLYVMTGYDLEIFNNPMLSGCAISNLCEYLNFPNQDVNIHDNASGCSSASDFDCGEYGLSGIVYFDQNENGVQDVGEEGMGGVKVLFEPAGEYVFTGNDGRFFKECEEGVSYTMTATPFWYMMLTSANASYTETYSATSSTNSGHDFGYRISMTGEYGNSSLICPKPKCNTDAPFYLSTQFTGNEPVKASFYLDYDANTSFVSSVPPPSDVDLINRTITWELDTMVPFITYNFEPVFSLPDENATGQPLHFWRTFEAVSLSNSAQYHMDTLGYFPIVLCSYDPNEKDVNPAGIRDEHYTIHNQNLAYTIRFQNVGNIEADNVTILDTLDENLDMETFRVLNSSFPVQTTIKDHIVTFLFENIYLADSTSNEPASHGFVYYEVKPNTGLADFTRIENTAHIIFDSNSPIITNTTFNTMVSLIPDALKDVKTETIAIHPNPTGGTSQIVLEKTYSGAVSVDLFNQLGEKVLQANQLDIDVSSLSPGIYFVKVQFGDRLGVGKLVIE